jgi:osmotically-inducible protein OsmY
MLNKLAALVACGALVMTVACAKTDAGITTNVKSQLAANDTVKAYQIDVDTSNGVVTLTGAVENPAAKEQAVMIARQTNGVRDVVDQITVNRAEATTGDLDRSTTLDERAEAAGESLADKTENAARATADKAEDLGQKVVDKTKELGREASDKTGNAARTTGDVTSDAAVTSAVKTKLLADPMVKGLKIDVDTSNGVVTLSGDVSSKAEMDKATMIARNTSGVSRVVSNLHMK